jgi:hypothetical protein
LPRYYSYPVGDVAQVFLLLLVVVRRHLQLVMLYQCMSILLLGLKYIDLNGSRFISHPSPPPPNKKTTTRKITWRTGNFVKIKREVFQERGLTFSW